MGQNLVMVYLMSHEKLAGVGIATELTREESSVIIVWVILHIHWVPPEGGEHLPEPLPVLVIVIASGGLIPHPSAGLGHTGG